LRVLGKSILYSFLFFSLQPLLLAARFGLIFWVFFSFFGSRNTHKCIFYAAKSAIKWLVLCLGESGKRRGCSRGGWRVEGAIFKGATAAATATSTACAVYVGPLKWSIKIVAINKTL